MKKHKWIYLFFAIFLPILLTFFLKYFGKSEFNIPVYFEKGISSDTLNVNCNYKYSTPYQVADSVFSTDSNKAMIITIDSALETKRNFELIDEELVNAEYDFVVLKQNPATDQLMNCVLFMKKPWTTVLIDKEKRIRGYYAPSTREETDRLLVEMKILLKKY